MEAAEGHGSGAQQGPPCKPEIANGVPTADAEDGCSAVDKAASQPLGMAVEVAEEAEVRGWYLYDFANSPYYQVLDVLMKVLMKHLAESAATDGSFPRHLISPGAYPSAVMTITAAFQVLFLLSLAPFGDFGNRRKHLLRFFTYVGSGVAFLTIFCLSSKLWWLAGVLRVLGGICFSLCNVYYNAYLPKLASAHYQVVDLKGTARTEMEEAISDQMSSIGCFVGYVGGFLLQSVSFVVLFVCEGGDAEGNEFGKFFPISVCIALVGVWWSVCSVPTFRRLKTRPGPPFPENFNRLLLGWVQTWETIRLLFCQYKQTLIFVVAYFIWSDSLATILLVSVLILDDTGGTPSQLVLSSILGTLAGLVGVFLFLKVQMVFKLSGKCLLLIQLGVGALVSLAGGFGITSALNGVGFYLVLGPVALIMGSMQSYTRALYSALTPVGREVAMFSFYVITDKGSSLIGTGVVSMVHTVSGNYISVFWYCMLTFLVSGFILVMVDVPRGLTEAGKASVDGSLQQCQQNVDGVS